MPRPRSGRSSGLGLGLALGAGALLLAACGTTGPEAGKVNQTGTIQGQLQVAQGTTAAPTKGEVILHRRNGQVFRVRTTAGGSFVATVRIGVYSVTATGPSLPSGTTCRVPQGRLTVASTVTVSVTVTCTP